MGSEVVKDMRVVVLWWRGRVGCENQEGEVRGEYWDLVELGNRREQEVESERRIKGSLGVVGWSEHWCVQGAAEEKGASVVS